MDYIIEGVYKGICGTANDYVQVSSMDKTGSIFKVFLKWEVSVKFARNFFVPVMVETITGVDAWSKMCQRNMSPLMKEVNEICKDLNKYKDFIDHIVGQDMDVRDMMEHNKTLDLGGI